jgi:hypothetical protein
MKILFYGNCQLYAILKTLNLSNDYDIIHIECWKDDINEEYFTNVINSCDIIITQCINDNYRDVKYLSTNYIKQHKNNNCKLILIDSCHFNFYYFDSTYKIINKNLIRKPIDYHYNKMIECYKNNKSIEYYIDNFVNNIDLKSSEELEKLAEDSLNELYNRHKNNTEKYKNNDDNIYFISTYEYIRENYKDKLLFWSINHPTKYVIQFICETIVNILKIQNTIDMNVNLLNNPKCILYKCIQKNVNFDINNYKPFTLNIVNINEITNLYYETYKNLQITFD